jgi:hypothetical protein
MRYHYLSGGVNTKEGWMTWNGSNDFPQLYAEESLSNQMTPVFSYYQMKQSLPGNKSSEERMGDLENMNNRATMIAYYEDFKALMKDLATVNGTTIVQVEPDLWGYIEQTNENPSNVAAMVSSTGLPELSGLPNNAAGFAQAFIRLRNMYAPHVVLGYHMSIWGTNKDIHLSHPSESEVTMMAQKASSFYQQLNAKFNLIFTEYTNRDAGYAQNVEGKGVANWWNSTDYARMSQFLHQMHHQLGLPIILWQIPVGNTVMDIMNNTAHHYQDNHVQWILGPGSEEHRKEYVRDGVVAFLFGAGLPNDTCGCLLEHSKVTNYAPIDGNKTKSFNANDDGGYFDVVAKRYYQHATPAVLLAEEP